MAQTIFKSTEGIIPMDYAPVYREKHIKGMLDRRIMGDNAIIEGNDEGSEEKPEPEVEPEIEPEPPAPPVEPEIPEPPVEPADSIEITNVSAKELTEGTSVITYKANKDKEVSVKMAPTGILTAVKSTKGTGSKIVTLTLAENNVEADTPVVVTLTMGTATAKTTITVKQIIDLITIDSVSATETTGNNVTIKYTTVTGEKAGVWSAPADLVSTTNNPVNGVNTVVVRPLAAVDKDTQVVIHFSTGTDTKQVALTLKPEPVVEPEPQPEPEVEGAPEAQNLCAGEASYRRRKYTDVK